MNHPFGPLTQLYDPITLTLAPVLASPPLSPVASPLLPLNTWPLSSPAASPPPLPPHPLLL